MESIGLLRALIKTCRRVHKKFTGASSDRSKRVVQGTHEPIISMELWNEVQAILNQRSRPPTKQFNRHYPMAGLLKCPMCGGSMVPAQLQIARKDGSFRLHNYYGCGNYHNKGLHVVERLECFGFGMQGKQKINV